MLMGVLLGLHEYAYVVIYDKPIFYIKGFLRHH